MACLYVDLASCFLISSLLTNNVVKMWFSAMGGDRGVMFWSLFGIAMVLTPMIETYLTWYLGYWARQYELHKDPSEVSAP